MFFTFARSSKSRKRYLDFQLQAIGSSDIFQEDSCIKQIKDLLKFEHLKREEKEYVHALEIISRSCRL